MVTILEIIAQKEFDYHSSVSENIKLINFSLDKYLEIRYPQLIWEAMRYSVLSGGKRLRPLMVLESTRICGGKQENTLPTACALELLHVHSLIHDDLPCMDNDDYRRGKLTNHKVYGEATAVLAGDALLSYAPKIITDFTPDGVERNILIQVLSEFLKAAGPMGIVGGQIEDLEAEKKQVDMATFNYIVTHKTGELFKFAMRAGALLSKAPDDLLEALSFYGKTIGYAFQIADDILDVTGSLELLGKTPGKDLESGKATHVSLYGLEDSKKELESLCVKAQQELLKHNIKSPLLMSIAENTFKKVL